MKKHLILLCFVFTLSSCSTQFYYNNIAWLLPWYLDDYVEFDNTQKALYDSEIESLMTWHRNTQLKRYVTTLDNVIKKINSPTLKKADIELYFTEIKQHWQVFIFQLSPSLIKLAYSLNQSQLSLFFNELEKNNVKLEKEMQELIEADEWKTFRYERFYEKLTDSVGRLSEQQGVIVEQSWLGFLSSRQSEVDFRRRWQQKTQSTLENMLFAKDKQVISNAEGDLTTLLTSPYTLVNANELLAIRAHNRQLLIALYQRLFPTLSLKQKAKLVKKINQFKTDFLQLSVTD